MPFEEQLSLEVVDQQAEAARLRPVETIDIPVRLTIARAFDDRLDASRRVGGLHGRLGLVPGQRLASLVRMRKWRNPW